MRHICLSIVTLLSALAIGTLLSTSAYATPSIIPVSGNISINTTWTNGNIYYVTGDTTVLSGVTLTIQPGVIVKLRPDCRLIIDGKLVAAGTASQPIYFTSYRDDSVGGDTDGGGSSSGESGDWNWIQFNAISDDASLIEHAVIRYGGGKSWRRGVSGNVYLRDASPTIRHSTLEYSEGAGVYLESTAAGSSAPVISNNRFSNNASSISTDVTSRPALTSNTSSANGTNGLLVRGGTINSNTNWDQLDMVYRVAGDITVASGATLTIAPGMIIKFNSNVALFVDGKLMAAGTASQPIYFTSYRDDSAGGDTNGDSSSGESGDWNWIQFNAISDDASLIEHAVIRYGGGKSWRRGVSGNVYLRDASPTIRHSTLEYSEGAGVYLESTAAGSSAPVISNNRFSNNASSISTDVTSRPALTSNTSSANGTNGLLVRGGTINSNTNWDQLDMVYRVAGDITVASGATLTIAPGMIIKFNSNVALFVDGKLMAAGTASQPIYFTSYRDDSAGGDTNGDSSSGARGDWNWIQFNANSDDTSLIEYAIIRYGGGDRWRRGVYGNVYLRDASPTIRNTTLAHSAGAGIYLESTLAAGSAAPVISNNQFSNNNSSINTDVTSRPALTSNTSSASGTNGLLVRGGTINSNTSWDQLDMVYRVAGDVTVANGATLTVAPGMIVKFNPDVTLFVDGKLMAAGTASQPIYFTSYRDDSAGGDTNGDSSSGARGDWNWIQFNANSDDTSLIEYAIIRYGGGDRWRRGVYGNVYLRDASPTIRNTTLAHSAGAGVYAQNATPTLVCNDIMNNATLGIHNASPSTIINAVNQYWGSPSGPKHATLNPNGQGNGVSDGVTFVPWQTTPCWMPLSGSSSLFIPLVVR